MQGRYAVQAQSWFFQDIDENWCANFLCLERVTENHEAVTKDA